MPEGDTLLWTAQRLNAALLDTTVTRSDLRVPELATTDLSGRTALTAVTYGKHLLQRFSGGLTLHSHLKMEGRWHVVQAPHTATVGSPQARRLAADVRALERGHATRALLYTEATLAAGTSLGALDLLPTQNERDLLGHLGPDLLAPSWPTTGLTEALARLHSQNARPLGEALLDQRNLAGLGTFWISEMLFIHRVFPWQKVADTPTDLLVRILDNARELMLTSGATGIQSSTGRTRDQTCYVHARSGLPCLRCTDTIRVAMAGAPGRERTLFSCPTCQGGYAPTDDGRPQLPLKETRKKRPTQGTHSSNNQRQTGVVRPSP